MTRELRKIATTVIGLFWLGCLATPAFAWRETGHFVVCQIALEHIKATSPKATAALAEILGGTEKLSDFPRHCTWPDMVRYSKEWGQTYDWHFINVDPGKRYFDPTLINPQGDLLQGLVKARKVIANSDDSQEQLNYLRFTSHFIGDLHHPLHTGYVSNRGGTKIWPTFRGTTDYLSISILRAEGVACPKLCAWQHANQQPCLPGANATCRRYVSPWKGACRDPITGECLAYKEKKKGHSLHMIWDLQLIEDYLFNEKLHLNPAPTESPWFHQAFARHITKEVTASQWQSWTRTNLYDWMRESMQDREAVYRHQGKFLTNQDDIAATYQKDRLPLLKRKLQQGGYRLGAYLIRILDPENNPPIRQDFFRLSFENLQRLLSDALGVSTESN